MYYFYPQVREALIRKNQIGRKKRLYSDFFNSLRRQIISGGVFYVKEYVQKSHAYFKTSFYKRIRACPTLRKTVRRF